MNQARAGRAIGSRVLAASVVLVLLAVTGNVVLQAGPALLWSGLVAGFQPARKTVEEEEDDPAASRTKAKKIRPVDEPVKPQTPQAPVATTDLARAAREAKHPEIKGLYTSLLHPADRLNLSKLGGVRIEGGASVDRTLLVSPLYDFVTDPKKELKKSLEVRVVDDEGKYLRTEKVNPLRITSIRYYEQFAIDEVSRVLESKKLSRYDQLSTAEVALGAVLRFHQSAREQGIRGKEGWDTIENALRDKLLDVQLKQLDQMIEAKSWDAAFELTLRLAETYTLRKHHDLIAKPLGRLLEKAVADPDYAKDRFHDARRRLRTFEDQFPGSKVLEPIRVSLREQAKSLFEQAKQLVKQKKKAQALLLLREAEQIWPELQGLREYRIEIDSSYQILRVGVRELPKYMSPAWAVTDSEVRAVDLLFESLVTLTPDGDGVSYYQPALAEGRVRVVSLGREFKLPRAAQWSDRQDLTSGDLSFTIEMLKQGKGTGRSSVWGRLLKQVRPRGDPFRVKLTMEQGYIDPLALMSFKVLPARTRPDQDPDGQVFAEKPISSGPFQYTPGAGGRGQDKGRSAVFFRANPSYGVRGSKLGLPLIREVHFIHSTDPVKELEGGLLDLALDLTAEQAARLREAGNCDVPLPGEKSVNRRIYFLAVNHRKTALASADFRIALARAINREELLDKHFRGDGKGLGRQVHRALGGPYPARSWACDPALVNRNDKNSLDPFDPIMAKASLTQALSKLRVKEVLPLRVKYPSNDPQARAAVEDLCTRVNKILPGVRLLPEARDPYQLRVDVEQTHSFELAYCWYDFPDETFWLMPLLGPNRRSGDENFLGYNGALVNRVQSATDLRNFAQVRRHAQGMHKQFLEGEMPFIPLWQLDPLFASKKGEVEMVQSDPHHLFSRIEHWRVKHSR
jgi:ABC-type oligopeptide transport system substrate-binding subunit